MPERPGILRAFVWYVSSVAIALGVAGLIVDLDHPATAGQRPELTERGDRIFNEHLPALRATGATLVAAIEPVAEAASDAFEARSAGDAAGVDVALEAGGAALERVSGALSEATERRDALITDLGSAPLSDPQRARLVGLGVVLGAATELPTVWDAFASAAETDAAADALLQALLAIDRVRGAITTGVAALD